MYVCSMTALHPAFVQRIRQQLGTGADDFFRALESEAKTAVSLHPVKSAGLRCKGQPFPWNPSGYVLETRPYFSADPYWHAGMYYVQEASSQFVAKILNQLISRCESEAKVLDLCAAPGGKSLLAAHALAGTGVLVSNEVIAGRVKILEENLQKAGYGNVIITNSDPSAIANAGALFDIVLVDAPCSGEGLFRKDPDARAEWSPEHVELCAGRQDRILAHARETVKDGGYLVYSTCTLNDRENMERVSALMAGGEFVLEEFDGAGWDSIEFPVHGKFAGQFWPHRNAGEGFFFAVMRRTGGARQPEKTKNKNARVQVFPQPEWLKEGPGEWHWQQHAGYWLAMNGAAHEILPLLQPHVRVVQAGIAAATVRGKLLQPTETLALSPWISAQEFGHCALSHSEAMIYLSGQAMNTGSGDKGYVLFSYGKALLGFGKHAGNRINNLYPSGWRLRKIPENDKYSSLFDE